MQQTEWEQVVAEDLLPAPAERDDLTLELLQLLDDPDPRVHEGVAITVLLHWVRTGVYDGVLTGFGDGLVHALQSPGIPDGAHRRRRAGSALVLAGVLARDSTVQELSRPTVLSWADRVIAWFLTEPPSTTPVLCGMGTVGVGAECLAALSAAALVLQDELSVLLDVVADRLLRPGDVLVPLDDLDLLAFAVCSVLHRDVLPVERVEPVLDRLLLPRSPGTTAAGRSTASSFLRALHLQLALGVTGTPVQDSLPTAHPHPGIRADLLLALQARLARGAPTIFGDR